MISNLPKKPPPSYLVTLGLPFIRISPDHGPNNKMIGQKKSDPQSLYSAINFFNKI